MISHMEGVARAGIQGHERLGIDPALTGNAIESIPRLHLVIAFCGGCLGRCCIRTSVGAGGGALGWSGAGHRGGFVRAAGMAGQFQLLTGAQNGGALRVEADQLSGVHLAFLGNAIETLPRLHLIKDCSPGRCLGRCCGCAGPGRRGGFARAAGIAG